MAENEGPTRYATVNKGPAKFVAGDKGAEKGDEILGTLFHI